MSHVRLRLLFSKRQIAAMLEEAGGQALSEPMRVLNKVELLMNYQKP